jgi:hypothetical protein
MKGTIAIAMTALALWSSNAAADNMRIRIKSNETEMIVTLTNSAASSDLVALLPLRLTLEDYGDVEKIGYLPRKLSTDGAPDGSTPAAGDVSYYAPWGNVAFFRKGFRYSTGLIALGKIDSGFEALNQAGRVEVLIERFSP